MLVWNLGGAPGARECRPLDRRTQQEKWGLTTTDPKPTVTPGSEHLRESVSHELTQQPRVTSEPSPSNNVFHSDKQLWRIRNDVS